jgi:hypothetical protein
MGSKASPQARLLFKDAFDKLEQTVSANHPIDARDFHSTTLQDVRAAAKQIEQELGARQCLRNMRRIEPFFAGLERYSKVVEVLCNGTAYLPWIWAPVKLVLQVSMVRVFGIFSSPTPSLSFDILLRYPPFCSSPLWLYASLVVHVTSS